MARDIPDIDILYAHLFSDIPRLLQGLDWRGGKVLQFIGRGEPVEVDRNLIPKVLFYPLAHLLYVFGIIVQSRDDEVHDLKPLPLPLDNLQCLKHWLQPGRRGLRVEFIGKSFQVNGYAIAIL